MVQGASPKQSTDDGDSSSTAELWRQPSRAAQPKKRLGSRIKSMFRRK